MRPDVYTPTFRRALVWYCNNGFFARDLDADDHAFLEGVRERGRVACGSLSNPFLSEASPFDCSRRKVFEDELEYWQHPYGTAPNIVRPALRLRPLVGTENPEYRRATLEQRKREKAIAEAELERERAEWERAQQLRELRAILSDREWEEAAPLAKAKKARPWKMRYMTGGPGGRFYIPSWAEPLPRPKPEPEHKPRKAKSTEPPTGAPVVPRPTATVTPALQTKEKKPPIPLKLFRNARVFGDHGCRHCFPYNGHHTSDYWRPNMKPTDYCW